jgi:hypothetical protein
MALLFSTLLANIFYIGGGVLGIVLVLIVVMLIRRQAGDTK